MNLNHVFKVFVISQILAPKYFIVSNLIVGRTTERLTKYGLIEVALYVYAIFKFSMTNLYTLSGIIWFFKYFRLTSNSVKLTWAIEKCTVAIFLDDIFYRSYLVFAAHLPPEHKRFPFPGQTSLLPKRMHVKTRGP